MKNKSKILVKQQTRRSAIKRLMFGTAATATMVSMPKEWAKPLVDVVLLPAHAATSPDPVYELSVINVAANPSQACSGNIYPPIDVTGVFTLVGCSAANIVSIAASLPGGATLDSSIVAGGRVSNGTALTLKISNYPSTSAFACMPPDEASSVTIEYNCADFEGPNQTTSIDILGAILSGSA